MSDEATEAAAMMRGGDVYARLAAANPDEARAIVLDLLARQNGARLELAAVDGRGVKLRHVDLSKANLRGARLDKAVLAEADLRGANLEQADLRGADLISTNLRGAALTEADLTGALLEDADLDHAGLRFADLTGAVMENARLNKADLWGATLVGSDLTNATLDGATLNEADLSNADLTGADLRGASLVGAKLENARLFGADLRGADLRGANLDRAMLKEARLEELDLSSCRIKHVSLSGARFKRTRFRLEQLDGAIGEELAGEYEAARTGYLALESSFTEMGDPDAASWSYRKRRRMQKLEARRRAVANFKDKKYSTAVKYSIYYLQDKTAELVCDYGESIPRVLLSLVFIWVAFAFLYEVTDSVVRVVDVGGGKTEKVITHDFFELGIFSLLAMTTSGSPAVGLLPSSQAVHFITGLQALLGISFTGLLGFVVGNRIRR